MDIITGEEMDALDRVWHRLLLALQKTGGELWNDRLEGASTLEVSILSIIEKNPDVILKQIAEMLGVPGSTLTNAIDRLEKRGLIRRAISERDRRSFRLELTEDGRMAQIQHKRSEAILWERVLGSYDTGKERRDLIGLLNKLADHLTGKE